MLFGGLGVFRALAKGLDLECACMGTVLSVPLSTVALIEDFGMAAMAGVMLIRVTMKPTIEPDAADSLGSCPLPISDHKEIVLAHGSGGKLTHRLIEKMILPQFRNELLEPLHDGAVFSSTAQTRLQHRFLRGQSAFLSRWRHRQAGRSRHCQ